MPNRANLLTRLDQLVVADERFGLLVFNVSQFREINIEMGHAIGDQVLQALVDRVSGIMRASDQLFCVGGDEFAVVLAELSSPQLAELAAARILDVIGEHLSIDGDTFYLSAYAGVTVYPDQSKSRSELLQAADAALNEARRTGCGYRLYDSVLHEQSHTRSDLRSKLQIALSNNDLMMYYQPQVDLQQGVLSGCETLARWHHDSCGWISPELFIPLAERSQLIESLTYWSVNVALREWFQYCAECSSTSSIAINLSAKLLHSPEVVDLVARAMNIWDAPAGSLIIEVTESAMMTDPVVALRTLTALNELGVTISIDDFGTGYSSLAYLRDLPVGELKIDKSFVQKMARDRMDRKIVQSVIDLAHNLELKVVAEGVEDRTSLDMLEAMGCDFAQGYFIAKPMPLAEFPGWLENSRWKPLAAPGAEASDLDGDTAAARVAEGIKAV